MRSGGPRSDGSQPGTDPGAFLGGFVMQEIQRYRAPSGLSPTDTRRLGRSLARIQAETALDVAQVDRVAEIQTVRAEAIAQVGAHAMQSVALLSQLEQQLALTVPMASGRLQAIADMTALGVADVVADTTWKVKRC